MRWLCIKICKLLLKLWVLNNLDLVEFDSSAAVIFDNVTVARNGNIILDAVSASVPRGSCTAIIGPNGAGKTTLLLALLGQLSFVGSIRLISVVKGLPQRIGYVPQRLQFDRGMPLSVLEFMVMGWQRLPLWFGVQRKLRQQALELLAMVKMEDRVSRQVGALSGGEMQRVLLALALSQTPDLLVLDEPASGVDFQGEQILCELLGNLRESLGFTQLMVSHDLVTVTHHATHVIALKRGVIAEGPPRAVLNSAVLTAMFGLHQGLASALAFPDNVGSCTAVCCRRSSLA